MSKSKIWFSVIIVHLSKFYILLSQSIFTCSKSTMKTPEECNLFKVSKDSKNTSTTQILQFEPV